MSQPLLILGLDGLDIKKTNEWTPELLLEDRSKLNLNYFDTISTYDIWPTMYMGETPTEHHSGDRSVQESVATNWNSLLRHAEDLAGATIPPSIKSQIRGLLKRDSPTTSPQIGGRELFEGNTIFDSLKARIIDVPGWNFRNHLDIRFSEESLWEIILEDDGVEQCYDILEEEIDVKVNATEQALDYPYDIVWTHFHTLDSVQHLFDREIQQEWYERVSKEIQPLIEHSNARGVIILSDHGLHGGDHRPPGVVASSNKSYSPLPKEPHDVRSWLEGIVAEDSESNRNRLQHLANLGYREVPDVS